MKKKINISVIIPCYNEEENLNRGVLKEVFEYLKKKKFSWEVIISDDGSSDNSVEIVNSQIEQFNNFKLIKNEHGGKPSALLAGILISKGKYILFTDMDQSTPIGELEKLLPFVDQGYISIIGSRGVERKNFPVYRKIGAFVFSTFRRMIILPEIKDTQCGFKLFSSQTLKKLFPRLEYFRAYKDVKGWSVSSFDVELLHLVKKNGGKIKEVIVRWSDKDETVNKKGGLGKYFRESREMFFQILRVKINENRGLYK